VPTEPPSWEILVSHHLPARYDRTLCLSWRRGRLHLCARCTGQLLGVALYLALFLESARQGWPLFSPPTQIAFAVAPAPAAIDWLSQSLGARESANWIRVPTGTLLGMAATDALALLLTERWMSAIAMGLVAAAYAGIILILLRITGGWRRVVEEHFPGIES
jgi:uncharacterized membrane protein